jgi:hypothetical protein
MSRRIVVSLLVALLLGGGLVAVALLGGRWLASAIPDPHAGAPTTPDPAFATLVPSGTPVTDAQLLARAVHPLAPGEPLVTADQIRAWLQANPVDVSGDGVDADTRMTTAVVRCMADRGWWFDPRERADLVLAAPHGPERLALDGPDYGMNGESPDSCMAAGLAAIS